MKKESIKDEVNFKQLLWENGFTDTSVKGNEEIAKYFNVTTRTIRRWLKDNKPSKQAIKLLKGKKKALNNHWNNFNIIGDTITTPNGYTYTARDLENLAIEIARIKALNS